MAEQTNNTRGKITSNGIPRETVEGIIPRPPRPNGYGRRLSSKAIPCHLIFLKQQHTIMIHVTRHSKNQ